MSTFLNSQIGIFLIYFIAGMLICLIYDVFRALRKTVKTSDFVTNLEDTIFWIFVAIFLIYLIFILNNGKIRFFMFIAICLGGISYYFTLSKYFINISVHILGIVKIMVKKIISILVIPLKLFLKINKKVKCIVCINLKNISKNIHKNSKKKIQNSKKKSKLHKMFYKLRKNKKVVNE